MPRACKACVHPKRAEIDAIIRKGVFSWQDLIDTYDLAMTSAKRHGALHVDNLETPAPELHASSKPKFAPDPVMRVKKPCGLCEHADRLDIERKYVRGVPVYRIEKEHGITTNTLWWHVQSHVPDLVQRRLSELEARENTSADSILHEVTSLLARVKKIVDEAEKANIGMREKMAPFVEARKLCELLARFEGILAPDVVVQITQSPQFITIAKQIVATVRPCDKCGPAVRQTLLASSPPELEAS